MIIHSYFGINDDKFESIMISKLTCNNNIKMEGQVVMRLTVVSVILY